MKNLFLLIFFALFLMPINIFALEYTSSLSGGDTIYTKHERLDNKARTSLRIDVSNIRNISHFELYVKYDNDLIGLATCNYVNFIGGGCGIISNGENTEVRFIYNGEEWQNQIDEYPIYTVTFMPIDATPAIGNTTVYVYFKNAKDKDGNDITINPSSKTFKFEDYNADIHTLILEDVIQENIEENDKKEITNDEIIKNQNKDENIIQNDNENKTIDNTNNINNSETNDGKNNESNDVSLEKTSKLLEKQNSNKKNLNSDYKMRNSNEKDISVTVKQKNDVNSGVNEKKQEENIEIRNKSFQSDDIELNNDTTKDLNSNLNNNQNSIFARVIIYSSIVIIGLGTILFLKKF